MSLKTKRILKKLLKNEIKVVSFDIFDTLLLRSVKNPKDIWHIVGDNACIPDFYNKRNKAEAMTRQYLDHPYEDCTLVEIYDAYSCLFNCTDEEARRLAQIEMDVEYDSLYPNNPVQSLYNDVLKSGKEIIITSDMYLPSEFLHRVLKKNNYNGYSKIYVSCEERLSKESGNLFGCIVSDYIKHHVSPMEICHIGDNYRSDFLNAKKAKLKAVHIGRKMKKDVPLKERLRVWGYYTALKFNVLRPARHLYRFLSRQPDKTNEVRLQVDDTINKFPSESFSIKKNNIIFAGNIHQAAYTAINAIAKAMPEYNWIYFTVNQLAKKKMPDFLIYSLPQAAFNWDTGGYVKLPAVTKNRVQNEEYLNITAARIMKSHPKMGSKYSKFIVCELERLYESAIRCSNPRLLILWNKYQSPNCIIDAIARRLNIPVVYMETGELPGTLCIDPDGHCGESWVARESDHFLKLPVTDNDLEDAKKLIKKFNETGANRYPQTKSAELVSNLERINNKRPTLLFAGNYDPESGIYPYTKYARNYQSPVFGSSFSAVYFLSKIAKRNKWNLIYKPHPFYGKLMIKQKKPPKNIIIIKQGDINDLIDFSDLVIGLNSSVVYSGLIRGKPVMTLGYTALKGKSCTYEAFSLDSIETTVKDALENGYTSTQQYAFTKHVAQMNKYYLYENLYDIYNQTPQKIEHAINFIKNKVIKKGININAN